MDILVDNFQSFIFVLIRISVIFSFGVFFGDKRIPKMLKIAFAFMVSMVVYPTINYELPANMTDFDFIAIIVTEVLIGITIGMISSIIVNVLQMAGSIIDVQGGFGMAQVFDPTTQSQTSIIAQFLVSFGLLFFIANDLHVTFLEIIIDSFKTIPIGSLSTVGDFSTLFNSAIEIMISSIGLSFCIAMPIIGVIFMVDVILGIATRTMPQLNLFSVGYMVKIFATLALMYVYSMSLNFFTNMVSEQVFKFLERLV